MSGSHEKLPWLFWVQLVLAGIIGVLYLTAPSPEKHAEGAGHEVSDTSKQALKPIGEVAVNSTSGSSAGGSERAGKAIVEKTCQSCHANGVANAPKLDESAKAAWEARYANGMDSMIQTAKTGKGAMPPMGTDPTLSDAEMKNAIVYMLEKAGVAVGEETSKAAEPSEPASEEVKAVEPAVATSGGEKTTKPIEVTTEASTPEAPEAPKAPEPPVVETTMAATTATVAAAPATPVAQEEVAEKSSIDGAKIYTTACFACHGTGAAGAPKLDDKSAWEARMATGNDTLYTSAIKGKGAMPPKGGYMNLSDDEIKAAVDHMTSKVQ